MKPARLLLPVLFLIPLAGGAAAQHSSALEAYESGIASAQRGDTTRALDFMGRATDLDESFADAHFQKGLLLFRRSTKEGSFLEDRLDAQDSFEEAIRWEPENPRYWLELGKLLLLQEIRIDAIRVFARALERAEEADAQTLADLHYQLAIFREVQWLRFRDRHRLPSGIDRLDAAMAFADPRYVWRMMERSTTWSGQGLAERDQMLSHLRLALQAHPAHVGAASQLLAYYYDEGQMDEFLAEARRFARAAPSEPKAYLALGLGLHASGRQDEAAGSFQFALELMPPRIGEEFLSVARLMTRREAETYEGLTPAAREEMRRRFWLASDPLFLTPTNEFRGEYLARMAYADLRYGVAEYKLPGWRTDKGVIYVRYGDPLRSGTFSSNNTGTQSAGDIMNVGTSTTVWSYGPRGPAFVFRQNPGYRRATFSGDFRFYAEDYRSMQPSRMTAPSLPDIVDMPAQIARFRGSDEAVALEVHVLLPLDTLGKIALVEETTLETGMFVIDQDGVEIRRLTEEEDVAVGVGAERTIRSWRTDVPAGKAFIVAAEVRDPITWATGMRRENIGGRTFAPGTPTVSDILVANRVEPLVEEPLLRHEFDIDVEPTLTFGGGQPVALYFELYNLVPDAEQFASYELELVVYLDEIFRAGGLRQLTGAVADAFGLSEEGSRPVELRFDKEERVVARDMIPEYFSLTLDDPTPGRYTLELRILDRNAGVEMTTTRTFQIRLPE